MKSDAEQTTSVATTRESADELNLLVESTSEHDCDETNYAVHQQLRLNQSHTLPVELTEESPINSTTGTPEKQPKSCSKKRRGRGAGKTRKSGPTRRENNAKTKSTLVRGRKKKETVAQDDGGQSFTRFTRAKRIEWCLDSSEDESGDEPESPNKSSSWLNVQRCIGVGEMYQADVPQFVKTIVETKEDGSTVQKPVPPSTIPERGDLLLWSPSVCDEKQVKSYLKRVARASPTYSRNSLNQKNAKYEIDDVADNEKALYHLMKCGGDVKKACSEKALLSSFLENTDIKHMTRFDCMQFEAGMLACFKDFQQIRDKFLPNKTTEELIEFFYHWKKNPRYEEIKTYKPASRKKLTLSQICFVVKTLESLKLPYKQNASGSFSVTQKRKHTAPPSDKKPLPNQHQR